MKHKPVKRWEIYKKESRRTCPRCGDGYWLAEHKSKNGKVRYYCGKCHYTEFV